MRQPLRRVCLAAAVVLWAAAASAQHGHHHAHWGRFGPGWGASIAGPFLPYGYGSFGGFGGLSYYHGPVGPIVPFGYPFGYQGFGPYIGYGPGPVVVQTEPIFIGPHPADNPAIQEWMPRFKGQNGAAAPVQPRQADVRVFIKPASPEAVRKSVRYQAQGDEWFLKQNYLQAYAHYKQAYSAAPDRPEPRYRLAIALAALGNYGPSVDELKRLVRIDPELPAHGDRLDDLFGADRNLSKNQVLHKVSQWVREDVRDPDRLFLMGVLLHFNEDRDKAKTFFETASLLAGDPEYVRVFLSPVAPKQPPNARPDAPPAAAPNVAPDTDADGAPVPRPPPEPASAKPRAEQPARDVAGPKLLPPGEPVRP